MYSLEQIEKIWKETKPLYFRLVEGEKSNGVHRHTDFVEVPKGTVLSIEEREKQSSALYDRFLVYLDMVNDAIYTVSLQPNKTASSAAAPFTFAKGDVSHLPTKSGVGSAWNRQNTEGGNWGMGMGAQSPMMLMIQMMQQQNTQQQQLMQQNFQQQLTMMQTMFAKDMELAEAKKAKSTADRVFGMLEKPHVWGVISKFAPPQPVAVGRAQAAQGEQVPRDQAQQEEETPPPPPSAPDPNAVNRLRSVLAKVSEAYPDRDPIEVLDEGFEKVQIFMQMQKND